MSSNPSDKSPLELFKEEISKESAALDLNLEQDITSLEIWKMFNSKNSILPNNKRILNLAWRLNSINSVKTNNKPRHRSSSLTHNSQVSKPSISSKPNNSNTSTSNSKKCSNDNLKLLKQHGADVLMRESNFKQNQPKSRSANTFNRLRQAQDKSSESINDPEFDYIEHIRKISKEEYGINPDLVSSKSNSITPSDITDAMSLSMFGGTTTTSGGSNPINIDFEGKGLDYFSPETSHSLSSNTNSIFSAAATRPSSYHGSSFSAMGSGNNSSSFGFGTGSGAAAYGQSLPQMNAHAHTFNQMQQMQRQHDLSADVPQEDNFNIDNFLKFDDHNTK
ncbi:unnamed protein product [Ambrosiozyma monospora]|uniref:Unnamed protein product n=1 Tax=Ambrosiozyma monospora TaxID=43982 RepID=A0ACB5TDG2_AMBMO|nr:unnamed protein product [Ambrosiozyma monospora]